MNAFTLEKKDLNILLEMFLKDYKVYGPVKSGYNSNFEEIKSIDQLHLDYISTVLPPKKFFLPPKEVLFNFKIKDGEYSIEECKFEVKSLILGIHPCDIHAILKLDKFFLEEYSDIYYERRRKNSILVAFNCVEPDEYSFCYKMGTGPFIENGYDILFTDIGTKYLIEIGTDIGQKIIRKSNLEIAIKHDFDEKNKRFKLTEKKFKKHMNTTWLSKIAHEKLDHSVWLDLGEHGGVAGSFPCLSCGSCTFVCPTCYCNDIYDKMNINLKSGTRNRELDSCQLLEYGEVALGGNFRRDRTERIKHWMLCKFGAAAGKKNSSCVGCGRCIRVCPSKIDITEVAKILRGDK